MPIDYFSMMHALKDAAILGGDVARKLFGGDLVEISKSGTDFLTKADQDAQKVIETYLEAKYPSIRILGEEDEDHSLEESSFFTIDPVDGTFNFSRKNPDWGTIVGYVENGEPTAAAIYLPEMGLVFYGAKGMGTFKSDGKSESRLVLKPCENFTKEIAGTDLAIDDMGLRKKLTNFLGANFYAVRVLNSTAQAVGELLLGWSSAFFNADCKTWDCAPCLILIREANGMAFRLDKDGPNCWDTTQQSMALTRPGTLPEGLIKRLRGVVFNQ